MSESESVPMREPTTNSVGELKGFRAAVTAWHQHHGRPRPKDIIRTMGTNRNTYYVWMRKWTAEGVWPPGADVAPRPPAEVAIARAREHGHEKVEGATRAHTPPAPDPSVAATKEFLARTRDDASLSDDVRTKAALGLLRAPLGDSETEAVIPDEDYAQMLRDAVALEFGDAVAGALAAATGREARDELPNLPEKNLAGTTDGASGEQT